MPLAQIFLEAFAASLPVPLSSQPTFFALLAFGVRPLLLPALAATAGAFAAHGINFLIGRWVFSLKKQERVHVSDRAHALGARLCNRWLLPLLLLTWVNFGAFLPLLFGFFGVSPRRALPLVLAGQAGYYLYRIYGS